MRPLLLALAFTALPLAALAQSNDKEDRYDDLRDLSDDQPMRIEDSAPSEPGPSFDLSMTNVDDEGDSGLFAQPQFNLGLPFGAAVGVDVTVARQVGDSDVGPLRAYGQLELLEPLGRRPGVGLKGSLISPTEQAGLSGELALLMTQEVGLFRLHGNGSYLAQGDQADRYLVGAGLDRPISEKVLLMGSGYWERQRDQDANALGVEGGAAYRLNDRLMVQGVVGMQRNGPDFGPRAVILLSAQ